MTTAYEALDKELAKVTFTPPRSGKMYHCNYCGEPVKQGRTKRHGFMHRRTIIAQHRQHSGAVREKPRHEVRIDYNGYARCPHCRKNDFYGRDAIRRPTETRCFKCEGRFTLLPY